MMDLSSLSEYYGFLRSYLRYYGIPFRSAHLVRFYARFIRQGDLCFDIGAHLGSRVEAWSRLGARVVAVEPQHGAQRFLRLRYGRQPGVTLVESAVAARTGIQTIYLDRRNPTVATLSPQWISRVSQVPSFAKERWTTTATVPATTLDALIQRFGTPAFCKLDVEGYEYEALKGLSRALPCLSFEYIPAAIDIAYGCLERLESLGEYRFDYSIGESLRLSGKGWVRPGEIVAWLNSLSPNSPSGDIYARMFTLR